MRDLRWTNTWNRCLGTPNREAENDVEGAFTSGRNICPLQEESNGAQHFLPGTNVTAVSMRDGTKNWAPKTETLPFRDEDILSDSTFVAKSDGWISAPNYITFIPKVTLHNLLLLSYKSYTHGSAIVASFVLPGMPLDEWPWLSEQRHLLLCRWLCDPDENDYTYLVL